MSVYVTVDTKVLEELIKATSGDLIDTQLASAAAEAAYFHATVMLGSLPDAVKGKLNVTYSGGAAGEAEVHYQPKGGTEGSTIQTPKTMRGAVFIPLDKLGSYSTRNPVFASGGDEGIFVSKVGNTGRPSIEGYLMAKVNQNLATVNNVTQEWAMNKAVQELKQWFAEHGIVWNASAARYQTTATTVLPTGSTVPAGRFVVGEF